MFGLKLEIETRDYIIYSFRYTNGYVNAVQYIEKTK